MGLPAMLVTVALCTWNRDKLLDKTLAGMNELRIPDGVTWEILVVNNNCTDDTDAVIERRGGALPLRRLFEPKQGHSNARNCAMDHARGDLVIWTDDDVRVDPFWLHAYIEAAARWPKAAYFGGFISPWYKAPPPRWVSANESLLQGLLVTRNLGPEERLFAQDEQPFGANMAFRTSAVGAERFDPALGRMAADCVLGDETQLLARLRAKGHCGVWVPEARVRHYVPASRTTVGYFWRYYHGLGKTAIRMGEGLSTEGKVLFGAPRWWYRSCWTRFCPCLDSAPWGSAGLAAQLRPRRPFVRDDRGAPKPVPRFSSLRLWRLKGR